MTRARTALLTLGCFVGGLVVAAIIHNKTEQSFINGAFSCSDRMSVDCASPPQILAYGWPFVDQTKNPIGASWDSLSPNVSVRIFTPSGLQDSPTIQKLSQANWQVYPVAFILNALPYSFILLAVMHASGIIGHKRRHAHTRD